MSDLETTLVALLLDPRIGLPTVLLVVGIVAAALLYPRSAPRVHGHESLNVTSDKDPVSRTYLAIQRQRYSTVLAETYRRLDRAVEFRTGAPMRGLPRRSSAMRDAGVPDPRGLRRVQHALDSLEWRAHRLEAATWLRADFWRSEAGARAHLLERSRKVFLSVDEQLRLLEHPSP
jgi:hypothetical protein